MPESDREVAQQLKAHKEELAELVTEIHLNVIRNWIDAMEKKGERSIMRMLYIISII